MRLKAEALNALKLPLTVRAGFVGTITLKVGGQILFPDLFLHHWYVGRAVMLFPPFIFAAKCIMFIMIQFVRGFDELE